MKRIFTALVLIPFALYAIFWAPHSVFVAIVALMATACYHEYAALSAASGAPGPLWVGFVLGYLFLFDPTTIRFVPLIALTLALRLPDLSKVMAFSASLSLGVLYVFGAWRCAIDLHAVNPYWILFALSITQSIRCRLVCNHTGLKGDQFLSVLFIALSSYGVLTATESSPRTI